jgi:ubiquinone/menaquinone biosynthesis C-methylase UbiE
MVTAPDSTTSMSTRRWENRAWTGAGGLIVFRSMTPNQTGKVRSVDSQATHEEHVAAMKNYYQRTAQSYNSWHCDPADESSHNYAVREVLRLLSQDKHSTLLDVCCGTGRCLRAALDAGYDVQGLDVSVDLLKIAETELKIPKERLHCGDATKLPFADKSFDISCIMGALHHSAMPQAIISEMIRVTRRAIVVSDEANHLHGGVKRLLTKLGIFNPVYRLIFRRPPRTTRRLITSDGDGPTFVFSIEEILPSIRASFPNVKCLTFYGRPGRQIRAYWLPRWFARQGIITAQK